MDVRQLVTAEQLWEMLDAPGSRYELKDGEVVEVAGSGALHGLIVELVLRLLGAHVRARRLGVVSGDGTTYILRRDPDRTRIPDVSFVSWGRVPEEGVPEGFWPLAPDLAVEVVSPRDRDEDVNEKVRDYLEAGVRRVWVLRPRTRSVVEYGGGGDARELGPDDTLDGGELLPGFRMRAAELFAVPEAPGR